MGLFTIVAAALAALVAGMAPARAGSTLEAVRARGYVQCGVNDGLYGFSARDDRGRWSGLDVDACRAVAAAVLGDAGKIRLIPLSIQNRLSALRAGEVDVLTRNTTWTLTRDASEGVTFTVTNYYDGQGFLVPRQRGIRFARQLDGATICVQAGSTSETNLAEWFPAHGLRVTPMALITSEEMLRAFLAGRCHALTADAAQLAVVRAIKVTEADDYMILPDLISKEPLTPVVRQGDEQWADIVRWSLYALIAAEEKGVTSGNVEQMQASRDPDVRRLLGVTPGNGAALGLDERWAYSIVKQVGNYGESFERNLGKGSWLKMERGLNALYSQGGLMYAPPFR